jgi:hypothetical protein
MGTKSSFFRAFVEGQTISDGRVVTAEMIDQAVETFSLESYTPGVNIEHLSGFSPEPPFNRYGDVVAVKAQTDTITIAGKEEQRRALYAQVDALDSLVTLAKSGQKPFPSVELTGDYAGTKKVGLLGLAFTDNPASIATQKLQFSRAAAVHGSLVVPGTEGVALGFEAAPEKVDGLVDRLFSALSAKFSPQAPTPPKDEPKKPANDNFDVAAFSADMGKAVGEAITAAVAPITAELGTIKGDYAALKTQLANTEAPGFSRAPSPGGTGAGGDLTDC